MVTANDIEGYIARCALGDRAAFDGLYDATSAKLYGICLRVLKDRAAAEDALQEAYVKIWHAADRYAVNGLSPISWMATIARNAAIDRLRARVRRREDGDDVVAEMRETRAGPEQSAIAGSDAARIVACLGELGTPQAEAVRGAYLDGRSYADLAATANVPVNTMRTWLRRALIALRECMGS